MATTAIFAEILVVGIWTLTWLAFLAAAILDVRIPQNAWTAYPALVTVAVLSYAYSLGIVVDRLADSIHRALSRDRKRDKEPREASAHRHKRGVIRRENPGLNSFLEYVRSRLRVARSLGFNAPLVAATAAAWAAHTTRGYATSLVLVAVFCLILTPATWYATRLISHAYEKNLSTAYKLVMEAKAAKKETSAGAPRDPSPS